MSGRNPRVSNGHRRRELRRWWKAQGLPCALCGGEIDYSLPAGHPMSFEVDEILPVSRGGDPLSRQNTQPVHRVCNQRKSNRLAGEGGPRRKVAVTIQRSGKW